MDEDVPADVEAVLLQLFEAGSEAAQDGDSVTARETVERAETVIANKLPESDLKSQLHHGCERAHEALEPESEAETAVAVEYLAAMERRIEGASE